MRLARANGVHTEYRGVDQKRHYASSESVVAVLRCLGVPIDSPGEAAALVTEVARAEATKVIEPVVVHRPGVATVTAMRVPHGTEPAAVGVSLVTEAGEESSQRLSDCRPDLTSRSDAYDEYEFRAVSGHVDPGYHSLVVALGGADHHCLVIAAPAQCPEPERTWGVFMPLYALRHETEDAGTGTYPDLERLRAWTESRGGGFVGTHPLLATYIDTEGAYPGPYLPATRLAWNEAFIDIGALEELGAGDESARRARTMFESPGYREARARLAALRYADIPAVIALNAPLLELLAESIMSGRGERHAELMSAARQSVSLDRYARFAAACDALGADWRRWPGSTPGEIPAARGSRASYARHLYAQWAAGTQLSEVGRGGGLYLDVPVGVHGSGFDTWSEPASFATGASGGAPPDDFFAGGQTWGFPPLHPDRERRNGYSYVIRYLRHMMAHASMIRVDHAMGLHRLYWVPDGTDAREGAYVRYHADEMHAVLALEAARSGTVVAGEDLGTVPASVRRAMSRDGMLSSFVMKFESSTSDPLPSPAEGTLATMSTHDLPTFDASWNARDIEGQVEDGVLDEEDASDQREERARWREAVVSKLGITDRGAKETERAALRGMLTHLAASPSAVVMVDLEDLWLEAEQQNRPGTSGPGTHNFQRRAARSFESFCDDQEIFLTTEAITTARGKRR